MDELRLALELATEEELQQLTDLLFRPKFNPFDYLKGSRVLQVQSRSRTEWLDSLEQRFRFLAADGVTVLKRKTANFSYRQALIQVCHYLKVPYKQSQGTTEIESEIFLHLLGKTWAKLPGSDRRLINQRVQRSLTTPPLGVETAAIQAISRDPINSLLQKGSLVAVNTLVRNFVLQKIAQQFAYHFATYQMARASVVAGAALGESYLALHTAQRGMAMAAARYGAVRAAFAFLGPLLWSYLFMDLGWRAIATNYTRIIPVIFALAQIRMTREDYWQMA